MCIIINHLIVVLFLGHYSISLLVAHGFIFCFNLEGTQTFSNHKTIEGGKVYYISSSTGNDCNNGLSPDSAIMSFDRLATIVKKNRLCPGDSVLLKSGDIWMGETLKLNFLSGTLVQKIVISSYGTGPRAIMRGSGRTSGIWIKHCNFVTIKNIEIRGYGYGIIVEGDSNISLDSLHIRHISIRNSENMGIKSHSSNLSVTNCNIDSCGGDGIYAVGTSTTISSCTIRDNDLDKRIGDGIHLDRYSPDYKVINNRIRQSVLSSHGCVTITDSSRMGKGIIQNNIIIGGLWGITAWGKYNIVNGNLIINSGQNGAAKLGGKGIVFYNNVIYNSHIGIYARGNYWQKMYKRDDLQADSILILNNTFIKNDFRVLDINGQVQDPFTSVSIYNNVIYDFKIGIVLSTKRYLMESDYNLWYPPSGEYSYKAKMIYGFEKWKHRTGFDIHSSIRNPVFEGDYNFSLKENSSTYLLNDSIYSMEKDINITIKDSTGIGASKLLLKKYADTISQLQ